MTTTNIDLQKLCELSKLSFDEYCEKTLSSSLEKLISISHVLDGISFEQNALKNVQNIEKLREDVCTDSTITTDELFFNAGSKTKQYITVPKVIE